VSGPSPANPTAAAPEPPARVHWLRGMILGTVGIVLALGLVWFGTLAVPIWQVRSVLANFVGHPSDAGPGIERLGGPEAAARKVIRYLGLPRRWVPPEHRDKALNFLLACGKPAIPGMILLLKDEVEGVRIGAVELMTDELGQYMDETCVEPLIAALDDPSYEVRFRAAVGLGCLSDQRAVEPLIAALRDEDISRYAADALAQLGGRRAAEALIDAIRGKAHGASVDAKQALARMQDPLAAELLLAALGDSDPDVREPAARALGNLQDPRAFAPLLAALKDGAAEARTAAAEALGRLGDRRAVEALAAAGADENLGVRLAVGRALAAFNDPRALGFLVAALRAGSQPLRRNAAEFLGRLGGPEVVEPLIAALNDEDPWVCSDAMRALEFTKDRRAIEPLKAFLRAHNSGWLRDDAERALKVIERHASEAPAPEPKQTEPGKVRDQ
jgi:HEAT repeat protein